MCILHGGHRCGPNITIGRTWDDVRPKVRKHQKVWSARRARWQRWKNFGVDWNVLEQQSRIVDIKHSRRFPSKDKCKIIDADKRVVKKLKVKKLSIRKQPGICVIPSLDTCNVEAKMFKEEAFGASQVKRRTSSKRNASCFPSSYFLKKDRKKKKPGIQSVRVLPTQEPVHSGPRYSISFREADKAYRGMRKGRGFYPSKKVIWKNRHALVLGCSNFYRKGKADENVKVDNKEYDIVEPPEPFDDPVVPTAGGEFSSDDSKDGPVKRNFNREKKNCENYAKSKEGPIVVDQVEISQNLQMSRSSHGRGGHIQQEQTTVPEIDFSKVLQSTAHRRKRVQMVSSNSPMVHHKHDRMQRSYSSPRVNDFLDTSSLTTDTVIKLGIYVQGG